MESKTKHRILGVVVVAGIAVLAYPFIQGGSSMPVEQALVKAPPFPDQTIQVASTEEAASSQTQSAAPASTDTQTVIPVPDSSLNANNNAPTTNANPADPNPTVTNVAAPETKSVPAPDTQSSGQSSMAPESTMPAPAPQADNSQSVNSNEVTSTSETTPATTNDDTTTKAVMTEETNSAPVKATVSEKKKHHKIHAKAAKNHNPVFQSKLTTASAITANRHRPVENLMQLKQAAWVVQIGSFKEKSNALKLVNKLRAKGYRAFIQHVSSGAGQTRVFVGPEHKQDSARLLASELQNEMKLHGIVISYKPFSL